MNYVDGFAIPVKLSDKQAFIDHARHMDAIMIEEGALRIVECWADDVSEGKQTDFYRAVDRQDGETVCFSWIEWPDKATRDAAFGRMMQNEEMTNTPMPFDGKRMIFGGFVPVVLLEKGNG
ncbi:DUF1428 domain-containing protein [Sphingomonas humi]|uniref:DUF1428 domain-containing protein n=1 Tax=Sphingomonas humi TaxID=335630 RepID=A0ABP7RHT8_9SPHN